MVEPEFVLVDGPPTTVGPDGVGATVVDRAGRRGMRRRVLVDVKAQRPHRRLPLLVAVLLVAVAAAGVVVWRRRRAPSSPNATLDPEPRAGSDRLEAVD
jgi:hypothetical protein